MALCEGVAESTRCSDVFLHQITTNSKAYCDANPAVSHRVSKEIWSNNQKKNQRTGHLQPVWNIRETIIYSILNHLNSNRWTESHTSFTNRTSILPGKCRGKKSLSTTAMKAIHFPTSPLHRNANYLLKKIILVEGDKVERPGRDHYLNKWNNPEGKLKKI